MKKKKREIKKKYFFIKKKSKFYFYPILILLFFILLYLYFGHSLIREIYKKGEISLLFFRKTLEGKKYLPTSYYIQKADSLVFFIFLNLFIIYISALLLIFLKKIEAPRATASSIALTRRRNKFIQNFIILLISLIVFLTPIECYLRLKNFSNHTEKIKFFGWSYKFDSELGWVIEPNKKGKMVSKAFGEIPIEINSKGFRDKEYDYNKKKDKYRIIVLGDSHVFGYGSDIESTFPKLLEKSLSNTEVLNLGVVGYSSDQEYILLKKESIKYNPDLVILIYCGNDYWFLHRKYAHGLGQKKPRFIVNDDGSLILETVDDNLSRKIFIFIDKIDTWLKYNLYIYDYLRNFFFQKSIQKIYLKNLDISKKIFSEMVNYSKQKNIGFLTVFIDSPEIEEDLTAYLKKINSVTLSVDLTGTQKQREIYFMKKDPHLTKAGYEAITREVMKFLKENKIK